MMSREDGKHMTMNELDESDIYRLMDAQYRIMNKQKQEEKQKELQSLDEWASDI